MDDTGDLCLDVGREAGVGFGLECGGILMMVLVLGSTFLWDGFFLFFVFFFFFFFFFFVFFVFFFIPYLSEISKNTNVNLLQMNYESPQ